MVNHSEFFGPFGGDATRYSYHSYLNPRSLVLEVGGYTGVDITAMQKLYGPFKTLLFEPVFHEEAKISLKNVIGVEIFPYGLGSVTRDEVFNVQGDGTQPSAKTTRQVAEWQRLATIKSFANVLAYLDIEEADLLQINCEGCEW